MEINTLFEMRNYKSKYNGKNILDYRKLNEYYKKNIIGR